MQTYAREALSVGGPQDNNTVKTMSGLEVADVFPDLLQMLLLGALKHVVSTVALVGSDVVRVVDGRKRFHLGHLVADLALEIVLQNLSTLHRLSKVGGADVPTAKDKVVGVDHGQDLVEGDEDILTLLVDTELQGRSLGDGTVVVGGLDTFLRAPRHVAAVCNDGSSESGTVVSTPADHHETDGNNRLIRSMVA